MAEYILNPFFRQYFSVLLCREESRCQRVHSHLMGSPFPGQILRQVVQTGLVRNYALAMLVGVVGVVVYFVVRAALGW